MEENKSSWLVPFAIIICLLLIGGAVYYKDLRVEDDTDKTDSIPTEISQILKVDTGAKLETFRPVDSTDHLRGRVTAPIKLVVYTDLECPACKYFHQQLQAVEREYVDTGKVAIILRNFPLDVLHTKSRNEALAAECVNELGGNDKFWQFIDKIFEITPSNDGLDPAKLNETASTLGIEVKGFEACMTSKKYAENIEKSVQEAVTLGAQGTPFFIITIDDQIIPIFGGLPAETLGLAFDLLLNPKTETTIDATNNTATGTETVVEE
ncbi:MAG TPA: thioredoxin domain-containing protein [Candidatus Paceibacterota bacterium]|nr:thioredoxin domain-containing protein [Candidatus Paceibacterota bacterium]